MAYDELAVKLVVARLSAMPPNVKLSVGSHGTFTTAQLIQQVKEKTPLGKAMVEMQLNYVRQMPVLAKAITQ